MLKILIVDDSAECAESLARLLRLLGHEVWTADCGQAGVDEASRRYHDLILIDLGMREMDGYEVARRLRDNFATRDANIVAISGMATEEDKQKAILAGFDRHLAKPVDLPTLETLIGTIARRQLDRAAV